MTKVKAKTMSVKVIRAFRANGVTVPVYADQEGKTQTVVGVSAQLGRELIANSKAVETTEPANFSLPKLSSSLEDELDEAIEPQSAKKAAK